MGGVNMHDRPVAYLDVDETLVDWSTGWPKAGIGAKEFLLRLMDEYEVRWLTYWCPHGSMSDYNAVKLGEILNIDPLILKERIHGLNWEWSMDKQDGIDWAEVQDGRPFIWIEDSGIVGQNLRARLERMGLRHCWKRCDLTMEKHALLRTYKEVFGDDLHVRVEAAEDEAERPPLLEPGTEGVAV